MCYRVLAYTQIGTFILVVMSLSWLFSTFLYPALLSTWGPVTREAGTWSCSTRYICLKEVFNKYEYIIAF